MAQLDPDGAQIRYLGPARRDVWESLVADDPTAVIFQTPDWMDCVCRAAGWSDVSRLYGGPDGRRLVLPLAARRARPRALAVHASMPAGWGTGGLAAPGGATAAEVRAVTDDLSAQRMMQIRLRPTFHATSVWKAAVPADVRKMERTVHVLDMTGGMDTVWSDRFGANTRRSMRTARKRAATANLAIDQGNSPALVEAFYELYLRWVDRRANARREPVALARMRAERAEPRRKFDVVAKALGSACTFRVARLDGRPVAAMITLTTNATAVYWRGYDDRSLAGPLHVPELLHLDAIEHACAVGCTAYEMGESAGVASLERFKVKLGGRPLPISEYRLERLPLTGLELAVAGVRGCVEAAVMSRMGAAART